MPGACWESGTFESFHRKLVIQIEPRQYGSCLKWTEPTIACINVVFQNKLLLLSTRTKTVVEKVSFLDIDPINKTTSARPEHAMCFFTGLIPEG